MIRRFAGCAAHAVVGTRRRVIVTLAFGIVAAAYIVAGFGDSPATRGKLDAKGLPTGLSVTSAVSQTASSRGERQRSRTTYRSLGDREARARVRAAFSGYLQDKGWRDLRDQKDIQVQRYVGPQAAVVELSDLHQCVGVG